MVEAETDAKLEPIVVSGRWWKPVADGASALLPFVLIGFAYFALCAYASGDVAGSSDLNYYPYLLDAFLHGHVTIDSPNHYDQALYNGAWYTYWGPGPILYVLPFYLKGHLDAGDVLFTVVAGFANVCLFALLVREAIAYFKLRLPAYAWWAIVLSFAFASPNLYLSLAGRIWFSEQIIATLYLLAAYYLLFKFLNNDCHRWLLVLSVVCFNLAWLSRYALIFNGLLYLFVIVHERRQGRGFPWALGVVCGVISVSFAAGLLVLNYLKFGSPLQSGQAYIIPPDKFAIPLATGDFWDLKYVRDNVQVYFKNKLPITFRNGFFVPDWDGNSVLMVYPALWFLAAWLAPVRKKLAPGTGWFIALAAGVVVPGLAFLLTYFASGWAQFGNRYFFDVLPLLFVLTLFVLRFVPSALALTIVAYGACVNVLGALSMYR